MHAKRRFVVLCLLSTGLVIGSAIASLLDGVAQEVDQLYSVITAQQPDEAKAAEARATIRGIMEKYFRQVGVPLPSYALPLGPGRWKVTQGNSTRWSHKGVNQCSWDLELVDSEGRSTPKWDDHKKFGRESYSNGRPIKAARESTYVWVSDGGVEYGDTATTIVLQHGDQTRSVYDHVAADAVLVREGQNVRAGQIIGKIGSTGSE